MAAGLDSLAAMELQNMISASMGVELPSTLVFDYPSVRAMSGFIEAQMGVTSAEAPAAAAVLGGPSAPAQGGARSAHLAGLAARMPEGRALGGAGGDSRCSVDAVCPVPFERWDVDVDVPLGAGKVGVRFGGFMHGLDQFDAEAFAMSDVEASFTDPQQRLLLETAWEALQCAGGGVNGARAGVYVGIQQQEYSGMAGQSAVAFNPFMATGGAFSVAAGRLSFKYGLEGPSLSVDTACSSSLVGLEVAVRHMEHGLVSDASLVLGVNLTLSMMTYSLLSYAGMLTPDGRCKTLDASADGYTRGEACNALMLLEGVPAAGPAGAAVVGCAVNQDGRSSSLTAPNGPSQQAVIRAAIADSAVPAEGVLGLQMHGTGTALGDPIEVSALSGVVLAGRGRSSPLALGAVKATSGHAEAAAGTAGVLQAAGSLAQRATALLPHVRGLNPLVGNALASAGASLEGRAPAQVPLQEGPQVSTEPAGGACAAGVSSFAYQGSNAHALVAVTEAGSDSREESGAWRRRRCWFTAASPNRLVERALRAPRGGVALLQVQLGGASGAEVHFRTVRGRRAVSESALLEAASAGLRSLGPQARAAALAEVTLAPVLGAEAGVLGLRLDLECGAVEVGEGELAGRCVVCSPGVQPSAGKAAAPLWGFGAAQRSSSAARLEVSQGAGGGYGTHPALLEGALQLSEGGLPAALEALLSSARPVRAARARAGRGARGAWDLALRGSGGAVCVRGLVHRGVQALGGRDLT